MEDPIYGMYRQQYFGYFPTCWRTFPPGWGCPSTEAPNMARAFTERPRDPKPENLPADLDSGLGAGPDPDQGAGMQRGPRNPPALPQQRRSPFELPDAADPGANPGGAGGSAIPPTRSPFDLPETGRSSNPGAPGAAALPRTRRGSALSMPAASNRIEPPQIAAEEKGNAPEGIAPLLALPPPAEAAPIPIPIAPADEPLGLDGAIPPPSSTPGASLGPMPTLPDPGTGAGAGMGPIANVLPSVTSANPLPPPAMDAPAGAPTGMPVQAPQRRGPISSLFNGMTSWLRR
jgi:hypothetical protein